MAQEFVAGNGAPVLEVRGLSEIERVVDTFVAPSKTFTDILRSSSWWLPFVLMVLSAVALGTAVDKKVGYDRVFQNAMAASPKQTDRIAAMEPAQKAQMMKFGTIQMKAVGYGAPLFLLVILAVYSLLLWAAFNFGLGAHTEYKQVLAVSFFAALPYLLLNLIAILTVVFGNDADAYNMQNPVGTNIAYYLPDASPMLKAALSSIDVIKLWSVVLQVIGMAIIARKTIAQSAVVVGIFWLLGIVLATGGAAFS